jgi:hypothetical protein
MILALPETFRNAQTVPVSYGGHVSQPFSQDSLLGN